MENIFRKVKFIGICTFITSCAFDGEYPIKEVAEISGGYYVVKDINTPDYGYMISYNVKSSNSGVDGEILTNNCHEIYYNADTIFYSQILVKGSDTTYYIIPIHPKDKDGLSNNPNQIKRTTFNKRKVRLNKVELPEAKWRE